MKKLFLSTLILSCVFSTQALAAFADGGAKFLGNITTSGQIREDFNTYWNQITAENGCKWGSIHSLDNSGKSKFSWDNYDKCESAYKWAKEKPGERFFKFHALIWGSQVPSFLCKNKNPEITVEKTRQYIVEWFDAVAAKFPDLEYIDVVNEAIWAGDNYHSGYGKPAAGAEGNTTDDPECGGTHIIDALGGDEVINGKHQYNFITTAFKMARERWPKAVLIYNDYNTLSWQMNEGIELIQTIVKNGAPVDVYGQQAHDCKGMSKSDFESKLTRIHNETGLPLVISEYDIGEANDSLQKNDYANHIPFMWETEWIAGITIWGYINGATWAQNTGIIDNGRDRAAMTWLKEYFASNLDKGKNTTGIGGGEVVDPVPQAPYNGSAAKAPGKVEAEHFDIAGVGKGNNSYSDGDSENQGDANFRINEPVDIYKGGTGMVLGYTEPGEWLEYTVTFDTDGAYSFFANVSAGNEGSSLNLYVDDALVIEELAIPQTGEENWDTYEKVGAQIAKISRGEHVVKLEVVGGYFNIDYLTFVAGANAEDPEPNPGVGGGANEDPSAIAGELHLNVNKLGQYDVFDMQGVYIGRLSAYSMEQAVSTIKHSDFISAKGTYFIKSKNTGKVQSIRLIR